MADTNPIFQGFLDRGLSPVHAAVLAGNMQQESGFDPNAVNQKEDAHGLIQWRNDRWQALQDFAKARGTDPTDRNTQMDFVLQEMQGPEKRAGQQFFAANDLPSANAAAKRYIRYGDDSQDQRLGYASAILGGAGQGSPGPAAGPAPLSLSPAGSPMAAPPQLAAAPSAASDAPFGLAPAMAGPSSQPSAPAAPGAPAQAGQPAPAAAQSPMMDMDTSTQLLPLLAQRKAALFAAMANRARGGGG